jgi:sarcosine oxidase gamma subunit
MSKQKIQIHIPRFNEDRFEILGFRSDADRPLLLWDAERRRFAACCLELT